MRPRAAAAIVAAMSTRLPLLAGLAAAVLAAFGASTAQAALSPADLSVVAGADDVAPFSGRTADVRDIQLVGDRAYVAGDFDLAGRRTGPAALVSGTTGDLDLALGSAMDQGVTSAADDGAGGVIVSGAFTTPRLGLLHVRADGTIDEGFPQLPRSGGVAQRAETLVRVGTTLYLGGYLTGITDADGAHARTGLAAVDLTTGKATGWAPACTDGPLALAVSATSVFAAGQPGFTCGGPHALVKLDRTSGVADHSFDLNARSNYGVATIRALALHGDDLFVTGDFAKVGPDPGMARQLLARMSASTGAISSEAHTFNSGGRLPVLEVVGDRLYVGGDFDDIDPVGGATPAVGNLAVLDLAQPSHPVIRAFAPNPAQAVVDAAPDGHGGLIVAGDFNSLNNGGDAIAGLNRAYVARIDATTGAGDAAWRSDTAGEVNVVVPLADGRVFLGGRMTITDGDHRPGVAAFDRRTGRLLPWSPSTIAGDVASVSARGDSVYLGGSFTTVGGVPRAGLAKVAAADGTLDATWDPGADATVDVVRATDDGLFVVGGFSGGAKVGGAVRSYVARVALGGSGAADAWAPQLDGWVNALVPAPDGVYLGGEFAHVGGAAHASLAKVDTTTGAAVAGWTAPALGGNGYVNTIAGAPDGLVVAGDFTSVGGDASHRYLVKLSADAGAVVDAWRPRAPGQRRALAAGEGLLLDDGYNDVDPSAPTLLARPSTGTGAAEPGFLDRDWNMASGAVAGGTVWIAGTVKADVAHRSFAVLRVGAPVLKAAPAIGGEATVGSALRCAAGTWAPEAAGFAYRWLRDGEPIAGATGGEYVAAGDDVGRALRCEVIASNDGGSARATSDAVAVREPVGPPAPPAGPLPGPGGPGVPGPGTDTTKRPTPRAKPSLTATCKAGRGRTAKTVTCKVRLRGLASAPTRLDATLKARGRTLASGSVRARGKRRTLGTTVTVVLRGRRAIGRRSAMLTVRVRPGARTLRVAVKRIG